ncbi:hypothetical protein FACS1894184_16990 [Clostridia bacterium]|nr:hypothetical protein FACS1894184_16990 [Clostridia bacterium]
MLLKSKLHAASTDKQASLNNGVLEWNSLSYVPSPPPTWSCITGNITDQTDLIDRINATGGGNEFCTTSGKFNTISVTLTNGLMYPAELMGDAEETINCRCYLTTELDNPPPKKARTLPRLTKAQQEN